MATTHSNSSKHVRKRKIADLNEEQRERKRNTDRQAQQAFRERTKAQIQDLEDEVETMRQNSVENEEIWRAENARLREKVRQLSHRLEQIQRLANTRLDVCPESSKPTNPNPQLPQKATQGLVGGRSTGSPGSIIIVDEVDSSPQPLNPDLREAIEEVQGTGGNEYDEEHQMLARSDILGHEASGTSPHLPTTTHQKVIRHPFDAAAETPNSQNNESFAENTRDVLMTSYDNPSAEHVAATPSLDQWLPPGSHSAHTKSAAFVQHSPTYRREVHEVVCEHFRTCPFDHILLNLVDARKLMLSSGSALEDALGPAQADISGLFQSSKLPTSHQISRVLVEMMHTFAHVNLPERAAFMYKIHKTLRWHIAPSQSTYQVLPSWLRPTVKQITTPHAAWIDNIPWPGVRDALVSYPNKYPFEQFSEVYSQSVTISWPHSESDIMVSLEDASNTSYNMQAIFNPIFERHIRDLGNWTVAPAFKDCYPELSEAVSSRH